MHSKTFRIVLLAAAAAAGARAQSAVRTVLGWAPDGVAALSANLNMPAAVAADSAGNVYVALSAAHQVVRIDASGIVWLVAGTGALGSAGDGGPARSAQLSTPAGLAVDRAGNLYISDSLSNRVRRVGTDGTITAFAGTGKSGNTGDGAAAVDATLKQPSALAFDVNGNLLIADTGNHVIRTVTPDGTISRVAGTGLRTYAGDDGPAVSANFDSPAGVAADGAGNIYISDTGNNRIRKVGTDGIVHLYAGTGATGFSGNNVAATTAYLYAPASLAVDKAGTLYVADIGNIRVRRITSSGTITSYAGTGVRGAGGDEGLARGANLSLQGIGLDSAGNLLIADGSNNRVRIVTVSNAVIDTLAGNGLSSYDPRGLAVNGDDIYFVDGNSHRVRRFNVKSGEIVLVAGIGTANYSGDGGDARLAGLSAPRGLALDSSGNLYIADSGNHRIRRVTTDGNIATIAGDGTAASTGDGTPATSASLWEPAGVAVDSSGTVYEAERSGQVVRKFTVGGQISTVAGTGTSGAPDAEAGVAVEQMLSYPQGIAIDGSGAVLIADSGNNRVRRVTPDGNITTVAGSGAAGFAGDGGPAVAASLKLPIAVTTDKAGNIYISDQDNHAIRMAATDGTITTAAGLANTTLRNGGFNGDGSPATAVQLNRPSAVIPAATGCSLLFSDTTNQRIRQLWPAVDHTITSDPAGLQVSIDGQSVAAPVLVAWLPGSTHRVDAPSPQDGTPGIRYVPTSAGRDISVDCGALPSTVTLSFAAQYGLTVTASDGGAVSAADPWQDQGASVTLTAAPADGFVFTGWEGDCTGQGACVLTMDGPKAVKADFAPAAN